MVWYNKGCYTRRGMGSIVYDGMPVIQTANGAQYQQHEWKILQQAKNTVKEHGLKSEAGRAMLHWLLTADQNIPIDCANIARLLLTPSQYLLWDKEWQTQAMMEAAPPRDQNDPLNGLPIGAVLGRGQFSSVGVQLRYPLSLIDLVTQTALRAFDGVPDSTPAPSFTNVKQGLTEPYSHFVDRLSQATNTHPSLDEGSRDRMF